MAVSNEASMGKNATKVPRPRVAVWHPQARSADISAARRCASKWLWLFLYRTTHDNLKSRRITPLSLFPNNRRGSGIAQHSDMSTRERQLRRVFGGVSTPCCVGIGIVMATLNWAFCSCRRLCHPTGLCAKLQTPWNISRFPQYQLCCRFSSDKIFFLLPVHAQPALGPREPGSVLGQISSQIAVPCNYAISKPVRDLWPLYGCALVFR